MSRFPVLKSKEVIKILLKLVFYEARQRGSHKQFRHNDGRSTTVPVHQGRDLSPMLARQIAKDIDMSFEKFLSYR